MLYDTHSHLDYPEFNPDIDQVVKRAVDSGVSKIVSIGTDLDSSRRAISLSQQYSEIYAAVGWHPSFAERAPENISDELLKLASNPKVVAIGEIGLDFYRLPSKDDPSNPQLVAKDEIIKEKQRALFVQQLKVAEKCGLNVIIHQRESFSETIQILSQFKNLKAVFHCFTDSAQNLDIILNNGWLVSYTGIVTFKNAADVRLVVSKTPLDKMMIETDAPFLAPVPFRGKRCEPSYVRFTAQKIAEIKNCSPDELASATCKVADVFFKFNKK